jgi:hypothetical protein
MQRKMIMIGMELGMTPLFFRTGICITPYRTSVMAIAAKERIRIGRRPKRSMTGPARKHVNTFAVVAIADAYA